MKNKWRIVSRDTSWREDQPVSYVIQKKIPWYLIVFFFRRWADMSGHYGIDEDNYKLKYPLGYSCFDERSTSRVDLKSIDEAKVSIDRHYWLRAREIVKRKRRLQTSTKFKKEIIDFP